MRMDGHGLSRQDRIRADNDYMKMKLMLERGAQFGISANGHDIPPELENRFLRNVLEFESMNENTAFITVFEKLGRPSAFRPSAQIPDHEIGEAWKELLDCLNEHQVTIGVCSPNVGPRDLYRFATEELFDMQVSSIDMPGLVHGFIYDEFHPDPVYDNPRSVIEGFIEPLFSDRPVDSMHYYSRLDLRLNEHYPLSQRQFMNLVNHFKSGYTGFSDVQLSDVTCTVDGRDSVVSGCYHVKAHVEGKMLPLGGNWTATLTEHPATGVWDIHSVEIQGIPF
ncbi:MAG: hypothetical protein EOO09_00845 [Chitinophagaceae bacterium]|nr:MAG: hypothetical protein EOO09_00845 [Chitinophagaceae bacterium]